MNDTMSPQGKPVHSRLSQQEARGYMVHERPISVIDYTATARNVPVSVL